ncbi:CheY-like superfamily [Aspergillus germanicus]
MSHELRSPLHGVLVNAELLQSTELDPAQRDMVTTVETCGEMLLDSLNYLHRKALLTRSLSGFLIRSTRVFDDEALSPKGQQSSGNLHVLIVDDNNINLKVLSTFLQKTGCTSGTASDGLSALQIYKETARNNFDYVLMDISMPVMDGITASRRILEFEEEKELRRSTILAVTSITCSGKQEQAFAAGMDDYLVKPLSLRDLRVILRWYI